MRKTYLEDDLIRFSFFVLCLISHVYCDSTSASKDPEQSTANYADSDLNRYFNDLEPANVPKETPFSNPTSTPQQNPDNNQPINLNNENANGTLVNSSFHSHPLIPVENNDMANNVSDKDSMSLDKSKDRSSNTLKNLFPKANPFSSWLSNKTSSHGANNTLGNQNITDQLAKVIGQNLANNATKTVTDMLSKLGVHGVALGDSPSEFNLYKMNISNITNAVHSGESNQTPETHLITLSNNSTSKENNPPSINNSTVNDTSSSTSSIGSWLTNFTNSIFPSDNLSTNQTNSTNSSLSNSQTNLTKPELNFPDTGLLPVVPPWNTTNTTSTTSTANTTTTANVTNTTTTTNATNAKNTTNATNTTNTTNSTTVAPITDAYTAKAIDSFSDEFGEIIYSSIYHNQGSYTPPEPYPTDPYNNVSVWPEGIDMLTNVGKNEMNQMGKWLRNRYSKLIGSYYNHSLITIDSGETDVILMSSECLASGMFPPKGNEIWNTLIQWQPVSIRTIPMEQDNIIMMTQFCQQYASQVELLDGSPGWLQLYTNYSDAIDILEKNTGHRFPRISPLEDLQKIYLYYEDLRIEDEHGLLLPNWTDSVFPEPMQTLALKYLDLSVQNKKMQKIKTGEFFKTIIEKMNNKSEIVNGTEQLLENLHIYSGNTEGLTFIMETLGIFNSIIPPTPSALLIELRLKNEEFIVTVFYQNGSDTLYPLPIPNCQPICRLSDFINITQDLISEDWNDDCYTLSLTDLTYTIPIIIFGIVIIIILILVVILLIMKCVKCCTRQKGKMDYD